MTSSTRSAASGEAPGNNQWYDVFGEGISNNEFRESYPTIRQPEPKHWDLAFHRNNVRTKGGAAIETSITDISKVGSHSVFSTIDFERDTIVLSQVVVTGTRTPKM